MSPEINLDTAGALNIVDPGQEFYFKRDKCRVTKIHYTSFEYKYMDKPNPKGVMVMTYDFYIAESLGGSIRHSL